MRYNVLYGILAGPAAAQQGPHAKRCTRAMTTTRAQALLDVLLPAGQLEPGRRQLFACAVCSFVLDTAFGNDIARLDPNNTYEPPTRTDELVASSGELMHDMAGATSRLRSAVSMLDSDIAERLVAPQWIDYAGAICLQLLREVL